MLILILPKTQYFLNYVLSFFLIQKKSHVGTDIAWLPINIFEIFIGSQIKSTRTFVPTHMKRIRNHPTFAKKDWLPLVSITKKIARWNNE